MSNSKLVDPKGNPIEVTSIPVIKYDGFTFPMRVLTKDQLVPTKEAVRPETVIREMRAGYTEMQDRFTLLSVGLSILAKKDPEGDLAKFLTQCGLQINDYHGKPFFSPSNEKASAN